MFRSRMFWRVFGTYGALLLSAIGLLGVAVLGRVETYYQETLEENLRTRATLIQELVRERRDETPGELQRQIRALGQRIGTRITLLSENGTVVADSEKDPREMENHADRPEVQEARATGKGESDRFSQTLQQPMMYAAVHDTADAPIAYVRVALPLDQVHRHLANLRRIIWTAAALTGVATLVLAFWLARRNTWPLQELTSGASLIAQGAYGHRVYAADDGEVGTLARSFNHMSERLVSQFAQIEHDRQQLRAVLGGMVEGVIALDADQRILFANERAANLLGVAGSLTAGRKLWEIVRHRGLQEVVRHALTEPEPYGEEIACSGMTVKSLMVHAAPLAHSQFRGVVLVLHDTTELRRLEGLRRDFVANVSHELKTPLSVIKVCVETLLEGAADDPEPRTQFLGQIQDQADRLHALILDLLSLARIESGTEAFEYGAVALGPLVTACLERHRARAESNHLQLQGLGPETPESAAANAVGVPVGGTVSAGTGDTLHLPAEPALAPDVVAWADEEAVDQILENLVDNALKYTPPGGRIGVRWYADGEQACLEVADTGVGIPGQDLPRIFERFYRVDKARSRELGGTGLGLSIVKHLVQAMRGSVQAQSHLGQGTTFVVRLPRSVDA